MLPGLANGWTVGEKAFSYLRAMDEKKIASPPGCGHTRDKIGFLRASEDTNERLQRGEKQIQCPECDLWLRPEEIGAESTGTAK